MKCKNIKKLLKQEANCVSLQMSEKLKNTPFEQNPNISVKASENLNFASSAKKFKPKFLRIAISSFCVIFAFCLGFLFLFNKNGTEKSELTSYILSINPEICITTNSSNVVVSAFSLNSDGDTVLSDETLDVSKNEYKLQEFIGQYVLALENNGFLNHNQENGKIRVSVINNARDFAKNQGEMFDKFLDEELKGRGFNNYNIEQDLMSFDDFRNKANFQKEFNDLDEMKDEIMRRRFFDPNFIPPLR